jgi:hypothetical protein
MHNRFAGINSLMGSFLLLLALHAHGGVVEFADRANFLSALSSYGVDNSTDNPINQAAQTQVRNAGSFGYTVSVDTGDPISGNFFTSTGGADTWLSPASISDGLNFGDFSPNVHAVGAYLFAVDDSFAPLGGQRLVVWAVDGTGSHRFSYTSDGSASFFGVISSVPLLSMTVSVEQSGAPSWVVASDVVLGNVVASVPEPQSASLLVLGLATLALCARSNAVARQV